MHSRRSGVVAATTASSRHNHNRGRAFDERDEELMELFLIVLLGWFVYDNYRNDKRTESSSLDEKGEAASLGFSKALQNLFFFSKGNDETTTMVEIGFTEESINKNTEEEEKKKKKKKKNEEEDPLAQLDTSLVEHKVHLDADGDATDDENEEKEDVQTDADTLEGTSVASPRVSPKRTCKGVFSDLEFGEC